MVTTLLWTAAGATLTLLGSTKPASALNNGVARLPVLGYNTWNAFQCNIDEDLMLETAHLMQSLGLQDAGYNYVNIDDCYAEKNRTAAGDIIEDRVRFKNGMKKLNHQIHALGFKTGITKDNLGSSDPWRDRHSEHNKDARAICEDELLALSPEIPTTVLNLAGLWGGQRSGGVHFIHGTDVAQAIVAVHDSFSLADSSGQRWIVTDGRVYDWWDLVYAWGNRVTTKSENELSLTSIRHRGDGNLTVGPRPEWVTELMLEHDVRALPRGADLLRRALDSREFWRVFGMVPMKPLLDG
ncbi:hypothetical protein NP233_g4133 [Leucocoprinus birnbaumii]|uniref:Alpha-galactosidase n=1 Tax=Leucocoprinus birnbaumii TaxID=56174 RepID=A0AAD5YXU4_9AGAR|nr:hypothetical protein NP233_g4133 [Leucocoprinus birnbaumii]